jgi:hypothetical protein
MALVADAMASDAPQCSEAPIEKQWERTVGAWWKEQKTRIERAQSALNELANEPNLPPVIAMASLAAMYERFSVQLLGSPRPSAVTDGELIELYRQTQQGLVSNWVEGSHRAYRRCAERALALGASEWFDFCMARDEQLDKSIARAQPGARCAEPEHAPDTAVIIGVYDPELAKPEQPRPSWANIDDAQNGQLLKTFGGTYQRKHQVEIYEGPETDKWLQQPALDCVAIRARDDGAPMVEIDTTGPGDHGCSVDALVSLNDQKDLVLRIAMALPPSGEPMPFTCWYLMKTTGKTLTLSSTWAELPSGEPASQRHHAECEQPVDYCGARGNLMSPQYPRASRKRNEQVCHAFDDARGRSSGAQ